MITNFEHLKSNKALYEKMLFVETILCEGESKQDYVMALSEMRRVLEIIMNNWVIKAGLSESDILGYMAAKGMDSNRVNLSGRIQALEMSGAISAEIAEELHYIRRAGNDVIQNPMLVENMSKDDTYRKAVTVYERLYKTSYEFSRFSTENNDTSQSSFSEDTANLNANNPGRNAVAEDMIKRTWPPVLTVVCVVISLVLAVFGLYAGDEIDGPLGALLIYAGGIFMFLSFWGSAYWKKTVTKVAYSLTDFEADAYTRMRNQDKMNFFYNRRMKLTNPKIYTPQMEMAYYGMLCGYMDHSQQEQFMAEHREFMDQMNQQQFMDQQQQFADRQQQFMDQQNADMQWHFDAFSDPLNSTEGSSIFNDSLNVGGGLDFGSGLDMGGGFGFGGGFDNFGL